jgi:flagellar biosynthesis protein FlhA
VLAISPDGTPLPLKGFDTKDPAFGLPSKWISENERSQAEMLGSTVVDAPSVLITHLREVFKRYASELLGREDVTKLIDQARVTSSAVVDELIPNLLSMGVVHRVLTTLLEERVPITNLTRILEALAHHAPQTKDPTELADRARSYLPRAICEPFLDAEHCIHAIVLEPHLELELRRSLQEKEKRLAIPPSAFTALVDRLAAAMREASQQQVEVALLVDSALRRPIRHLISRNLPDLAIIAVTEVPNDVMLKAAAEIKRDEVFGAKAVTNES